MTRLADPTALARTIGAFLGAAPASALDLRPRVDNSLPPSVTLPSPFPH